MADAQLSETWSTRLNAFRPSQVLNQDPATRSVTILGEVDGQMSLLIMEKTPFSQDFPSRLGFQQIQIIDINDIYHNFRGWFMTGRTDPDVKINFICPATDVHIRKYTRQTLKMFRETPEIYQRVVKPYIESFPADRLNWVYNILSHKKESEKILFENGDFLILPDFKWDLIDLNTLYLQAIVFDKSIRSLRDIRASHLPMLKDIRREAARIVKAKWGIEDGGLRLYVHYQPSYYHFHVHIVQVNYSGFAGMNVGQAHLLDGIISLLELDPEVFEHISLSYTLGDQHGLFEPMMDANANDV